MGREAWDRLLGSVCVMAGASGDTACVWVWREGFWMRVLVVCMHSGGSAWLG